MPADRYKVVPIFTKRRLLPDKPEKLAQCIPIYGTILGQRTRYCANAGPMLGQFSWLVGL